VKTALLEFVLFLNGLLVAAMICVGAATVYALRRIKQGRAILTGIQEVHNDLTSSIATIDAKAQECSLRLDLFKQKGQL